MKNIPLKRYTELLGAYLGPQRTRAVLLGIFLFAGIGLQLANPQIIRSFIDAAAAGEPLEALTMIALLFLGAGLLGTVISAVTTWLGADVGWKATNTMRNDLMRHSLALDMGFHNEKTPGEMIERIDGDVTALSNFFSQFVIRILGSAILMIGVLLLLYMEEWRVGVVLTLYACLAIAAIYRFRSLAVESSEAEREAAARLYGFIEERISGLEDIRSNGGGPYTMLRFHEVVRNQFSSGRRAWMKRSMLWVIVIGTFTLGDALALGVGIYLFHLKMVSLGTVYLFFQYNQLLRGFVEQINQQLQDLQKAGASISRVQQLLDVRATMIDGTVEELPEGALEVTFDDVRFGYGGSGAVLEGIDFHLPPGRVLGLLGRTGSGKTSITRLLFRLYDPAGGRITIGGREIRELAMQTLRSRVAMVTQEVQVFHATVRDNLTFFDRTIDDETIHAKITELGLDEWFDSMPSGLDTMLGRDGSGLSAGEAQLLAFTRVFLRDPGLVILDEPSSRMDLATEALLERAMRRLLRDRTAIIIAHRLTTVSRADDILILEDGHVLEYGTRVELEADPASRFARLLRTGRGEEGKPESGRPRPLPSTYLGRGQQSGHMTPTGLPG
jgi:ABC-type multidrug transport system fused ATPase/permease subunit